MDSSAGWLLDVSIEQNRATIWIKTVEGNILSTTEGHIWNNLKAETNTNYVDMSNYAKTKIPENARCDIMSGMEQQLRPP